MKNDLVAEIDRQIAHHEAALAKLRTARNALAGLNGTAEQVSPAGKKPGERRRAPPGALEDAMEKAIRAKPGMVNGEVGAAIVKAGYAFPVTSLHRGKRLSAMVDEKRLTVKLDGNLRRYYPAK